MKLKDKFLVYVEHQRNAEYILRTQGASASRPAFEKANMLKKKFLHFIDDESDRDK